MSERSQSSADHRVSSCRFLWTDSGLQHGSQTAQTDPRPEDGDGEPRAPSVRRPSREVPLLSGAVRSTSERTLLLGGGVAAGGPRGGDLQGDQPQRNQTGMFVWTEPALLESVLLRHRLLRPAPEPRAGSPLSALLRLQQSSGLRGPPCGDCVLLQSL